MKCPACEYDERYPTFMKNPSIANARLLISIGERVLNSGDEDFCEKHLTAKAELLKSGRERRTVRRRID